MEEKDVFEIKKSKKWIFGLIFILILLGAIGYGAYYFIQNNDPKKVLVRSSMELINDIKTMVGVEENYDKINIDSKVSLEVSSSNEEDMGQLYFIINKFNLNMYYGYDKKNFYLDLVGLYDNEDLGNITLFSNNKDNYLYLNDVYDKVIKIGQEVSSVDTNSEDYKKMLDYEKDAFIKGYEKINLSSKYVKLAGRKVREIKINNIEEVFSVIYNELINNKDYMNLSSKIFNISGENLKNEFENYKDLLDDLDIRVYLSMLKNKFIKLEITDDKEEYSLERENNTFSIKEFKNEIILNKLDINFNESKIELNFDDIENSLNIKVKLDYKLDYDSEIKSKDISSSIDYSKMNDKDLENIMNKFMNKKGFMSLMRNINGEEKTEM